MYKANPRLVLLKRHQKYQQFISGEITETEFFSWVANKAGQSILEQISDATDTHPKIFKLDNLEIQVQLEEALEKKEILSIQDKILCVYEFIRYVTAKKNGFTLATWRTTERDFQNDTCSKRNGTRFKVQEVGKILLPPHRSGCTCFLSYDLDLVDLGIHRIYRKGERFPELNVEGETYINPEALWIGGTDIVGKDKRIGIYSSVCIPDKKKFNLVVNNLDKIEEDKDAWLSTLVEAKKILTDVGFLQVVNHLGYAGVIETFNGRDTPCYYNRKYCVTTKEKAQDIILQLTNTYGKIHLKKIGINTEKENIPGELYNRNIFVEVDKIINTKVVLDSKRILNILDNFCESQKRGGNGISLIYNKEVDTYSISKDGNHRLFAAKLLGINKILVNNIYLAKTT